VKESKSQSKKAKEMHSILVQIPQVMYDEMKKEAEAEMRPLANYAMMLIAIARQGNKQKKRGQK